MNWEDLQKRYEEIVRTPASFAREVIEQLARDLDQFVTAHLGTEEAKQADKYQQELKDLLRKEPARNRDGDLSQAKVLIDGAPEDVRRGIELLESLLVQDSENDEIYELLTRTAKNSSSFETAIQEIIGRISPSRLGKFEKAIYLASEEPQNSHPSGGSNAPSPSSDDTLHLEELLKRAEDAYYSGEWAYTTELIEKVLAKDPLNQWAKTHLEKVRINQTAADLDARLPRDAKQFYRRARSLIIAKQQKEAAELLDKAIQLAEDKGISFPRAEELLDLIDKAVLAQKYKESAQNSLKTCEFVEALVTIDKAIELDSHDSTLHTLKQQIKRFIEIKSRFLQLNNYSNDIDHIDIAEFDDFPENLKAITNFSLIECKTDLQKSINDKRKELSGKFAELADFYYQQSRASRENNVLQAIELVSNAICNTEKAKVLYTDASLYEISSRFSEYKARLIQIEAWITKTKSKIAFDDIQVIAAGFPLVMEFKNSSVIRDCIYHFQKNSISVARKYWEALNTSEKISSHQKRKLLFVVDKKIIQLIRAFDKDFPTIEADSFLEEIEKYPKSWIFALLYPSTKTTAKRPSRELKRVNLTLKRIIDNFDSDGNSFREYMEQIHVIYDHQSHELKMSNENAEMTLSEVNAKIDRELRNRIRAKMPFWIVSVIVFLLWLMVGALFFLCVDIDGVEKFPLSPIFLSGLIGGLTMSLYRLTTLAKPIEFKDIILFPVIQPVLSAIFAVVGNLMICTGWIDFLKPNNNAGFILFAFVLGFFAEGVYSALPHIDFKEMVGEFLSDILSTWAEKVKPKGKRTTKDGNNKDEEEK